MFSMRIFSSVGMLVAIPATAVALWIAIALVNRLTSRFKGPVRIRQIQNPPDSPADANNPFSAPAVTTIETGSTAIKSSAGWILLIAFVQNVCRSVVDATIYAAVIANLRQLSEFWLVMITPIGLFVAYVLHATILTMMLPISISKSMVLALCQGLILWAIYAIIIALVMGF